MKQIVLAVLILAGLAWPALAADTQAMVLATKGKSSVVVDGKSSSLLTGSVLKVGARVTLESGATATLMVLPKGQRFEASGPAVLSLGADGLKAESGTLKAAAGPQVALVPSGKNMGHMGGESLRGPAEQSDMTSLMQDVVFAPLPGSRPGMRVTFTAPVNGTVQIAMRSGYRNRSWISNTTAVMAVQDGQEDPMSSLLLGNVTGVARSRSGKTFHYQVDVPFSEVPDDRLRVEINFVDRPTLEGLITRSRLLSAQQEKELGQAVAQYRDWAAKMPHSPEPWVLLMALYDENDKVTQAVQAGQKALERAPGDLGILTAMARLQLESGHYIQARKLFEQVVRLSAAAN